jgi:hypothetical protein
VKLPPHVRAMVGPDDIRWVGIRYADRHLIKRLPRHERTWSNPLRCWITPVHCLHLVREWLEAENYSVAVINVSNVPTRTTRPAVTTPTPSETPR